MSALNKLWLTVNFSNDLGHTKTQHKSSRASLVITYHYKNTHGTAIETADKTKGYWKVLLA